jgi:predicted membrane protein
MSDVPPDSATGPERAVQGAREAARRTHRFRSPCGSRSFVGVLLVGMGVLFLLDNLRIIEARYFFRTFWPLLIVVWGGARLMFGRGGERIAGAIALSFGGLLLGNRLFGWNLNVMGLFWPLILIALGLSMFFRPSHRWPPTIPPGGGLGPLPGDGGSGGAPDQSASLSESAIMAGVKRRNVSQAFRGGIITTVMGSVEVDLRDCRPAGDSTRIEIQVVMGQVMLRVPRDWAVESHVSAFMGNVEDRSDRPIGASSKLLVLEGSAFMGNVEIQN